MTLVQISRNHIYITTQMYLTQRKHIYCTECMFTHTILLNHILLNHNLLNYANLLMPLSAASPKLLTSWKSVIGPVGEYTIRPAGKLTSMTPPWLSIAPSIYIQNYTQLILLKTFIFLFMCRIARFFDAQQKDITITPL